MQIAVKDPSEIFLNVLGYTVEGFSKGTFITVARETPPFTIRKSLKNKTKVFVHSNSYYTLRFVLDSGCSANTWIHAISRLQQQYGISFPVPIMCKDNLGDSTFYCLTGIIQEPELSHATDPNSIEWLITCPVAANTVGGGLTNDSKLASTISGIMTAIQLAGAAGIDLTDIASIADKAEQFATSFFK